MAKIIIDQSSLEDFLSADGTVKNGKLRQRMTRYCKFIELRMTGVAVTYGPTSGRDEIPDGVNVDEYESVANLAGNNLDIICDGRKKLL